MNPKTKIIFFRLKENLENHRAAIPKEEASELHVIARNYSIKILNTDDSKYVNELFELYKPGLASKVLLDENEKLLPSSYKKIIAVGLKSKEFAWTEKFIRDYSRQLEEQFQRDYLSIILQNSTLQNAIIAK